MHKDGLQARQFIMHLPYRLEKRQAFNITHCAANLAQHEIDIINI